MDRADLTGLLDPFRPFVEALWNVDVPGLDQPLWRPDEEKVAEASRLLFPYEIILIETHRHLTRFIRDALFRLAEVRQLAAESPLGVRARVHEAARKANVDLESGDVAKQGRELASEIESVLAALEDGERTPWVDLRLRFLRGQVRFLLDDAPAARKVFEELVTTIDPVREPEFAATLHLWLAMLTWDDRRSESIDHLASVPEAVLATQCPRVAVTFVSPVLDAASPGEVEDRMRRVLALLDERFPPADEGEWLVREATWCCLPSFGGSWNATGPRWSVRLRLVANGLWTLAVPADSSDGSFLSPSGPHLVEAIHQRLPGRVRELLLLAMDVVRRDRDQEQALVVLLDGIRRAWHGWRMSPGAADAVDIARFIRDELLRIDSIWDGIAVERMLWAQAAAQDSAEQAEADSVLAGLLQRVAGEAAGPMLKAVQGMTPSPIPLSGDLARILTTAAAAHGVELPQGIAEAASREAFLEFPEVVAKILTGAMPTEELRKRRDEADQKDRPELALAFCEVELALGLPRISTDLSGLANLAHEYFERRRAFVWTVPFEARRQELRASSRQATFAGLLALTLAKRNDDVLTAVSYMKGEETAALLARRSDPLIRARAERIQQWRPAAEAPGHEDLRSRLQELSRTDGSTAAAGPSGRSPGLRDVQESLGATEAGLEWFAYPAAPGAIVLWSFWVTRERIDGAQVLLDADAARSLLQSVEECTCRSPDNSGRLRAFHLLFGPWEGRLDGITRLFVAADPALARVPLGALLDRSRRPVISRVPIVEVGSLVNLPSLQADSVRGPRDALVVACSCPQEAELDALKDVEAEGRAVGEELERAGLRLVRTDRLVPADFRDKAIVHYAGHARFQPAEAMGSALLGRGEQVLAGDLLIEDLAGLELVVLSACDTGRMDARNVAASDLDGFVRALLVAGASNVVVSLWPIEDQATASFMGRFHRLVGEGSRASDALRRTQMEFLEVGGPDGVPEWRHPHFWAGFVIFGKG